MDLLRAEEAVQHSKGGYENNNNEDGRQELHDQLED